MNGDVSEHLHNMANQVQILDLRLRVAARQTDPVAIQDLLVRMRETTNMLIDELKWLNVFINASMKKTDE